MRTHIRQFRELARLFFRRFLENDLICLDGDTTAALTNVLGLVAAPGILFPLLENWVYSWLAKKPLYFRDLNSLDEKALYVSFSMTVLGVVTVLEWDTLLPDRRDYLVLRPFPVRAGTILAAKITALIGFWAVFTALMNTFPTVAFPAVVCQTVPFENLAWFIRCHALTILAANAFVFLAIMAIQAVLMNLLGWRLFRRVSPVAQFLLIAALLAMCLCSTELVSGLHPRKTASPNLHFFPPAWFVGFYQYELGWRQPLFQQMAEHARTALWATGLLAAAGFAVSYRRHVRRSLESLDTLAAVPGRLAVLVLRLADRFWVRTPAERAAFHFVRITLLRSRRHRALLATWTGAGIAVVFQILVAFIAAGHGAWWHEGDGPLLPAPLILSFFLICGLRYAFTVPAELQANWLFRMGPRVDPREYMPGVWKAVIAIGIVPLSALLLAVHLAIWGFTAACVHVFFAGVVAVLLMDVLLAGFEKLPFTCSYVPGKANVKSMWSVYVLAFVVYLAAFTRFEYFILQEPSRIYLLLLFAVACRVAVRMYRREFQPRDAELVFDERQEPAVRALNILQP